MFKVINKINNKVRQLIQIKFNIHNKTIRSIKMNNKIIIKTIIIIIMKIVKRNKAIKFHKIALLNLKEKFCNRTIGAKVPNHKGMIISYNNKENKINI